MVFHTSDGSAFLGLRERNGQRQIVYDHMSGRRVVLNLTHTSAQPIEIGDVLKEAVSGTNILDRMCATLKAHGIKFQVML